MKLFQSWVYLSLAFNLNILVMQELVQLMSDFSLLRPQLCLDVNAYILDCLVDILSFIST